MKKSLTTSAISGEEFIVPLSVLISVILWFMQDLRELSWLICFQVLEEFFLLNSKLCKKYRRLADLIALLVSSRACLYCSQLTALFSIIAFFF